MANLQKYEASKKDRSCKSKKTSTKILASYSPVSTTSHLFLPACVVLGRNSPTRSLFSCEKREKENIIMSVPRRQGH